MLQFRSLFLMTVAWLALAGAVWLGIAAMSLLSFVIPIPRLNLGHTLLAFVAGTGIASLVAAYLLATYSSSGLIISNLALGGTTSLAGIGAFYYSSGIYFYSLCGFLALMSLAFLVALDKPMPKIEYRAVASRQKRFWAMLHAEIPNRVE